MFVFGGEGVLETTQPLAPLRALSAKGPSEGALSTGSGEVKVE